MDGPCRNPLHIKENLECSANSFLILAVASGRLRKAYKGSKIQVWQTILDSSFFHNGKWKGCSLCKVGTSSLKM